MVSLRQLRADKDLIDIYNYIRVKTIAKGKRPPTHREFTKAIAKRIDKDEVYNNEFIKI